MSWDKKYYKAVKAHTKYMVSHHPWCYDGDLLTWIKGFLPMVEHYANTGDYEAAQGMKDGILEFIGEHSKEPIPKSAVLIFPKTRK